MVVPLDDEARTATLAFLDALAPQVAVLESRADGEEGFDLHLVGMPWVQLLFVTTKALELADQDEPDDNEGAAGLSEDDRRSVTAAINELVATTPLSVHGRQIEALDLLMEWLTERDAELACNLAGRWFLAREYASVLYRDLKDKHGDLLRSNAAAFAEQVIESERLTSAMPKPMIRDRVYATLKRQDPTCVTRSAIEGVVFEAQRLIARSG